MSTMQRFFGVVFALNFFSGRTVCDRASRDLQGTATEFDESKLRAWGVPEGARLLVQSHASCGAAPPVQVAAKMAFLCDAFTQIRRCMNLTDTDAFTIGRGCTGQNCTMHLNTDDKISGSVCALRHLVGVEVDAANQTRSQTCGLDPNDAHWFDPFQNPVNAGDVACAGAYPENAIHTLWTQCKDGNPIYMQQLMFPSDLTDGQYTCFEVPVCENGTKYVSRMVCYAEGGGEVYGTSDEMGEVQNDSQIHLLGGLYLGGAHALIMIIIGCIM